MSRRMAPKNGTLSSTPWHSYALHIYAYLMISCPYTSFKPYNSYLRFPGLYLGRIRYFNVSAVISKRELILDVKAAFNCWAGRSWVPYVSSRASVLALPSSIQSSTRLSMADVLDPGYPSMLTSRYILQPLGEHWAINWTTL